MSRLFAAWTTIGLALGVAGCLEQPGVPCGSLTCAPETVCDREVGRCVAPGVLSACAHLPDMSACQYPGLADGICFDQHCLQRGCGNGHIEPGEACDDGNVFFDDGCSADCTSTEACGNGIIDTVQGEQCDDGNLVSGDGCQYDCQAARCGDGIVDASLDEHCDCGTDPSALPPGCATANADLPDAACRTTCVMPRCGDGVVDVTAGEGCDDGNVLSGDGCSGLCQREVCGNGIVDVVLVDDGLTTLDECDDGNTLELDGCDSRCRIHPGTWEEPVLSLVDGSATAYDVARRRIVSVGSESDEGATFRINAPSTDTEFASGVGVTYDVGRARTVLFGGRFDTGAYSDETWEWDGVEWTRAQPTTVSPSARKARLVYDAGHGVVMLFGGTAGALLGDTWTWDGTTWRDVSPASGGPSPRHGHALAYDPVHGQVLLFGGLTATGYSADTWSWDGASWTDVTPSGTSPSARTGHALGYDAAHGVVVLYGGTDGATTLGDTWTWNGTNWTEMAPTGQTPPASSSHILYYDVVRRAVVLAIGTMSTEPAIWVWDGFSWQDETASAQAPPAGTAMTYDAHRGRIVSFDANGVTWEWDGRQWITLAPSVSPPGRGGGALAYDPLRRVSVLHGGDDLVDDTWEWDGETWHDMTTSSQPPPLRNHAMTFDPQTGAIVVLGGFYGYPMSGMWAWDGETWTAGGSFQGAGRWGHSLVTDPIGDQLIVFGGRDEQFARGDTWIRSNDEWVEFALTFAPHPRYLHGATFDIARARMVVFGGFGGGGSNGVAALSDTWEWDGSVWRDVTPATSPPAGYPYALAHDAARGRSIVVDSSQRTWRFSHSAVGPEACHTGPDPDEDGVTGCDDEDCWAYCSPTCAPGTTCAPNSEGCGDGVCNAHLESCRLCPQDCGACTPVCGDFLCDPGENITSCPGDCS